MGDVRDLVWTCIIWVAIVTGVAASAGLGVLAVDYAKAYHAKYVDGSACKCGPSCKGCDSCK